MISRRKLLTTGLALIPGKAISNALQFPGLSPEIAPVQTQKLPVKLALVMDASHSMTLDEFNLQASGTANALRSSAVKSAIQRIGAVAISGFQFSSHVERTLPHAVLRTDDDVETFADLVASQPRISTGYTHISDALNTAAQQMSNSPYIARRNVIDISGDGHQQKFSDANFSFRAGEQRNFHAKEVRSATRRAAFDFDTSVNGLAICTDDSSLDTYFSDVIVTPEEVWEQTGVDKGRTWSVTKFEHIQMAMQSKLITELAGLKNPYNQPFNDGPIIRIG